MNDQNRVLARKGARELSAEEADEVTGGLRTETKCTAPSATCPNRDGDAQLGECGVC
jgi:hypothetical protein